MSIKLLLFDADGVLFQSNLAISEHLSQRFVIDEHKTKEVWNTLYKELSSGVRTTDEFIELFAKEHGIPEGELKLEDFTKPYAKALIPMTGMANLLDQLSAKKILMAVLSDTSEMLHATRRDKPIFKHFDKLFLSYETTQMKPNEQAFQNVLNHYKLKPGEVFFVDDSPKHVAAAKKLGLQGTIFTGVEPLNETLKSIEIL